MTTCAAAPSEAVVEIPLRRRAVVRGLWILAGVNVLAIAASWAFNWYYRVTLAGDWDAGGPLRFLGVQAHLAAENVLVTWYSSTLLFFAALTSLLCFVADRPSGGRRSLLDYGWLALGAVLMLLSADEVGSIHERIGMMPEWNLFGSETGWYRVLIVPIAVVLCGFALFGLLRVRRSPRAFALLLLAIACYGVNPLLERDQMAQLDRAPLAEEWLRHDVSLHVEEGAELFGALAFLAAVCLYLLDANARRGKAGALERLELPWRWLCNVHVVFLILLALGWWVIAATGFRELRDDTGSPQNWVPNALALAIAGMTTLVWSAMPSETRARHRMLGASRWFFLVLAAYYGVYAKGWFAMSEFQRFHVQEIASAALSLGFVACCIGLYLRSHSFRLRALVLLTAVLYPLGHLHGPAYLPDPLEFTALAAYGVRLRWWVPRDICARCREGEPQWESHA